MARRDLCKGGSISRPEESTSEHFGTWQRKWVKTRSVRWNAIRRSGLERGPTLVAKLKSLYLTRYCYDHPAQADGSGPINSFIATFHPDVWGVKFGIDEV